MPILHTLFERNPLEDISKSLGNVLVSGVDNDGCRKLYFNMLMDFLYEKKTIILVNGSLSDEKHKSILKFIHPHMVGRCGYDLCLNEKGDGFNVLSAFETCEQKADFIAELISMITEVSPAIKDWTHRFFLYVIRSLDAKGVEYKIKDLAAMDVDYVVDLVSTLSLDDLEKRRRLRFLTDSSSYEMYMDIESCLIKLESIGLLNMLSGDLSFSNLLKDGNVIMLNGMISNSVEQKEVFFNSFLFALMKCIERIKGKSNVAFVIKDADYIAGDYIKNILDYNSSYGYAAYIFVEDISRYIVKNGNSICDDSNSFIVFNQGSDENAAFWSAFFGNRDIQEKSYSYTKRKSWNPFADKGGVVASPQKYNASTTNFQKVNKPIYRKEIFRELKPNEAMCYLRDPLLRRKTRIEV